MARCSICYTVLREGEPATGCPECKQDYHKTCWDEIGGCGTYGCKQAAVAHKPPPPMLVGAGWGDTKPCPSCGQAIASSLLLCRCGARFPWADPMTVSDYATWFSEQESLAGARRLLILLFILSLTIIMSPVTGLVAGLFAFFKRKSLAGTNGTYLAMGYGSAALGGFFTILILLTSLGH
jgi:Prokaryotic RING finger family 1